MLFRSALFRGVGVLLPSPRVALPATRRPAVATAGLSQSPEGGLWRSRASLCRSSGSRPFRPAYMPLRGWSRLLPRPRDRPPGPAAAARDRRSTGTWRSEGSSMRTLSGPPPLQEGGGEALSSPSALGSRRTARSVLPGRGAGRRSRHLPRHIRSRGSARSRRNGTGCRWGHPHLLQVHDNRRCATGPPSCG